MSLHSASHRVKTRPPRGPLTPDLEVITDPARLEAVLHDAAQYPGGNTTRLLQPRSEAELTEALRRFGRLLPIGAQSSLTGGATPMGEAVLSMAHLTDVLEIGRETVRVQAGVVLRSLQEALAGAGKYYPPVPSYDGATVGGTIATNAAGPATFKYGSTRAWVQSVTLALASGDWLDLERGQCLAHPDGYFEIESSAGLLRVPLPTYRVPRVAKCSAGYYAAPGMDLLDLFIGSEGTLGIIREATLRVVAPAPAICIAVVPCTDEAQALTLTGGLRAQSFATRQDGDPRGLDVSAIEYIDARSLEIIHEDGQVRRHGFAFPAEKRALLLIQLELSAASVARAYDELSRALEADAPDVPLVRLARFLDAHDALQNAELVMPGERARIEQVHALREAVPEGVNARVLRCKEHEVL